MDGGHTASGGEWSFVVDGGGDGARLDVWLAARDQPFSRSALYRRIEDGQVAVNGATERRPHHLLHADDLVALRPPPPVALPDPAEPIPLAILFEDAHLVVVDKPAGLVVHPAHGHARGTLLNALLHHAGDALSVAGERRPGFPHRLDKGTSGLLVVAKDDRALRGLLAAFAGRGRDGRAPGHGPGHPIDRRYLAIVDGELDDAGTFDTPYGRSARDRRRFTCLPDLVLGEARRAVTHYRVLERFGGAALVEARLETGRTHQIRVHFGEHRHGLLGDRFYGRPSKTPLVRGVAARLARPALHAATLAFSHPITGEAMAFSAPPPADFQAALAALRS